MAKTNRNDLDASYDAWASSNPRSVPVEVDVLSPVVRRPGRPRGRGRGPAAPRLIVHDVDAESFDEPEYNVDEQLDRLTRKVVMRCHQEIANYSVPQLLSALHKCLQVRVLLQTLRLKGGGGDGGSAVRRYAGAFQSPTDDAGSRKRNSRSAANADDGELDYLLGGIADED